MGQTLDKIAQELKEAKNAKKALPERISDVKVQLIYAFNGSGKTRLSQEFKELISPKQNESSDNQEESSLKVLYYNAFTEDLFYWDNDLFSNRNRKLKIQSNNFTDWVLSRQGQGPNIINHFQSYTSDKLTPRFNERYTTTDQEGKEIEVKAYSEITFSIERGDDNNIPNIKISKGEESSFVWCVFYSVLEQVIEVLNTAEPSDRETDEFDKLEYVFIDDPVSSLDDNRLIELAVNIAQLIKSSQSELKFIITTHNPLFYNVLFNEFKKPKFKKYILKRLESGEYELKAQSNDSPFSYHVHIFSILKEAAISNQIEKYHFNLLRNVMEKTATFLSYSDWGELISKTNLGDKAPYVKRIINLSSHSKHSEEESMLLKDADKRMFKRVVKEILSSFNFNINSEDIDI